MPPSHPWPNASTFARVRRDQNLDPLVDDALHLLLVPIAGVCDDNLDRLADTHALKFSLGGNDHPFQVPEIGGVRIHLGGDHDLLLVSDRLRVMATSPLLNGIGGRYFEDCTEALVVHDSSGWIEGVAPWALDFDNAERLWDVSLDMLAEA
jgi:hypothetical protein